MLEAIGQFFDSLGTSKSVWVYIVFSLIGLYSGIFLTTINQKRWPKPYDFYTLFGYIPLVVGVAVLVGNSPLVSLVIGLAPDNAVKLIKSLNLIKVTLGNGGNGSALGIGQTIAAEDDDELVPLPPSPEVAGKKVSGVDK